jgi:hypothetical protein
LQLAASRILLSRSNVEKREEQKEQKERVALGKAHGGDV